VNGPSGEDIAMSGDIIVTTYGWNALNIYKRNSPTDVEYVTTFDLDDYFMDIEFDGNFVYLTGQDGLWTVDMSDYTNPIYADLCPIYLPQYMVLNGDYAYVGGSEGHMLSTVDISNPYNMPPATSQETPQAYHFEMLIRNNYLYMCNFAEGIMVFDISNPANPVHVSSFGNVGNPERICIDDNKMYMTEICGELYIFDLGVSPTNPPMLGSYLDTPSCFVLGLLVLGNSYAYSSVANHGLYVFDIQNPGDIQVIGDSSTLVPREMINDGNVIYAARWQGLEIIM
jgi:hypothetical protein